MKYSLLAERLMRTNNRLRWSARARRAGTSHVESVHTRDTKDAREGPEFVKRCVGPTYIEPEFGYVISAEGRLMEDSMLPNARFIKPPWRIGLPSASAFFKAQRGEGRRIEHYPKVISLRHFWEWNYYHFYVDVLGKIQLFDAAGIDPATPLVLGRYALQLPFVQQLIHQTGLKQRNWIIQDDAYVLADEVYYCRTKQNPRIVMNHILNLMEVPQPRNDHGNRIFLTRRKNGPRSIVNIDEIEPILRDYKFRTADTSGLSIREQIELFSNTRCLVAIHGAGMINMIYRREAPLSLLELYPASYDETCFLDISQALGYEADRLVCEPCGSPDPQHASLHVDPAQLRQKLERMLASATEADVQQYA